MSNQYYDQLLNANFAADYQVPDWLRSSGLAVEKNPEHMAAFFGANPQYAEDWARITSGGKSAFSTDGSSLIKSDFASMTPQAANYYANNVDSLLAAEGFGHDPSLQYHAYYGGMSGIPGSKTTNMSEWMRNNRATPGGGIQGGVNNQNRFANTAFGAGANSYRQMAGMNAPAGTGGSMQGFVNNKQPYQMPAPQGTGGGMPTQTGAPYGTGGVSMSFNPTMNPYAQQMSDGLAQTMAEQYQRQVQPQIASGAIAAGGFGGSRQAVLEANAANDLQQNTGQALTNLWGNMYGQGLNYDMGMQNLGLGYANLDRNINNDNLNWQMQGANFGLNMYDRMQQANQLGLQTGSQIQNTPWNYWQNFSNQANSIGQGYGTQTSSTGGNPFMGALGGAQLGSQAANWWNSQQPSNGTSWFTGTLGMGD